jgi:hypothetical protein
MTSEAQLLAREQHHRAEYDRGDDPGLRVTVRALPGRGAVIRGAAERAAAPSKLTTQACPVTRSASR